MTLTSAFSLSPSGILLQICPEVALNSKNRFTGCLTDRMRAVCCFCIVEIKSGVFSKPPQFYHTYQVFSIKNNNKERNEVSNTETMNVRTKVFIWSPTQFQLQLF